MVVEIGSEKEIFARRDGPLEVHLTDEDKKYLDGLSARLKISKEEIRARVVESAIANRIVEGLLDYGPVKS